MKKLKSSSSRLIRLFLQSRENWKKIALERHQKIRALSIKVRDLNLSRSNWKNRALTAERELRLLQSNSVDEKKSEKVSQAAKIVTATGHHYSVKTIQKAVQLSIDGGSSLRGVEKNFKLAHHDDEQVSTPSLSSIRNWLGRIGLYFLQRTPEYRQDWVFIIDVDLKAWSFQVFGQSMLGKRRALFGLSTDDTKFV